jgi:hypothetical protein
MARLDLAPQSALPWFEQVAVHDLTELVARESESLGRMVPWSLAPYDVTYESNVAPERAALALRQLVLRRTLRR